MEDIVDVTERIRFVVRTDKSLRTAIYRGIVNDGDLIAAYTNLVNSPDFDPKLNDLVDMREVEKLDVSSGALWRLIDILSELDKLGFRTKVAMVACCDAVYGTSRMYEFMRGADPNSCEDVRVFRDYDEALLWLNVKRQTAT